MERHGETRYIASVRDAAFGRENIGAIEIGYIKEVSLGVTHAQAR
jgi:hypothetical protein